MSMTMLGLVASNFSTTDENIVAIKEMILDNCRIMLAYRPTHAKHVLGMIRVTTKIVKKFAWKSPHVNSMVFQVTSH